MKGAFNKQFSLNLQKGLCPVIDNDVWVAPAELFAQVQYITWNGNVHYKYL